MFEWHREPAPHWREELYAIGGQPNENAAYLELVWWPGEPYVAETERQDVQRWCIVEALPEAALTKTHRYAKQAQELLGALHGPPPASLRTWAVVERRKVVDGKLETTRVRIRRSTAKVSQWQWELYRTTRCFMQPYWIIQGVHGGHLWNFPPAYQMLLRMSGRPLTPPGPGTLPYADWDNRVRAQLVRERTLREWLERWQMTRDRTQKTDADHKREDIALEREGRRQLLAWLDQQMGRGAEALGQHLATVDMPITKGGEPTDKELEEADEAILAATPTNQHEL